MYFTDDKLLLELYEAYNSGVFYHGTSIRNWISIQREGFMDSVKHFKPTALYKASKGNFLAIDRSIAEAYARKNNGVLLEIRYNPLDPGWNNNYSEQVAKGEKYFFERNPIPLKYIRGPKV